MGAYGCVRLDSGMCVGEVSGWPGTNECVDQLHR